MPKLLLKEENKDIKKEYTQRLVTLLFFGLSGVLFLFLISLIPAYFLLKVDQKVLNQELSVAQNTELNADRKKLKEKLSNLQQTLNIIDTPNSEISYYIQKVTERQPRDINILSLNFEKEAGKNLIIVQGTANSRSGLSDFVKTLETVSEFESVTLPFSSFAREVDIPFSITINIMNPEI
jgi:multidrug efflux pump subunit AcrB